MKPLGDTEVATLLAPLRGADKVALAVSGGMDSMALLALVARAKKIWGDGPEITVLTVNHGLRPEADQETRFVAKTADGYGFSCRILTADQKLSGGNIQASARDMRYRLMCDACHEFGAETLVTAHHLEDQAETFLLRLARGSGVDGLGAMASETRLWGINLVRPLLGISKARLRACLDSESEWIEDPSNKNTAFDRVKIRNLAPQLEELGLTPIGLAETALRMQDAANVLEQVADDLAARAVKIDPAGHCVISRKEFCKALPDTRHRLLSRCLTAIGGKVYRPRMKRLRDLMGTIVSGVENSRTLSGCQIAISGEKIDIWRETGRQGISELVLSPGDIKIWDGRFRVSFDVNQGQNVTVRALGGDGWRMARGGGEASDLPHGVGLWAQTMVSFWRDEKLLAVPHLAGFPILSGITADFVGGTQIDPNFGSKPVN